MTHLDYYRYQAEARGVKGAEDVKRLAVEQAFAYRIASKWLPLNKSCRIADLACGHGSFLWWLEVRGYRNAVGVDLSKVQVEIAKSCGLRVEQRDALTWVEEQVAESFDCLIAIDFIEHISKDDLIRLLQASHRALTPGSWLVLRYPNGDSPFVGLNLFNDITHVWTYTTNCLESLARMNGFRAVSFVDQSVAAIRDLRWVKVPMALLAQLIMGMFVQAGSKERVRYWSSSIWAGLQK